MKSRVKLVLILFAVVGVAALFLHSKQYPEKTEAWMEDAVPEQLAGYQFETSSKTNPAAKMDPMTYDILKPFGIVTRVYADDEGHRLEFVVIAGNSRKSFHDPQVCFSAQNWRLINPGLQYIDVPALGGKIPATVMGIDRPGAKGVAMYFYNGPMGFRHSPLYIPFDLTFAKLLMKDNADAQFFRFLLTPATTPDSQSPADIAKARKQDIDTMSKFADAIFKGLDASRDGRYFVSR